MLAAVSHDLRTPLARLKLNLTLLETPQTKPDIEAMQGDINHMDKIIETYLDFAKGVEAESIQRFDLAALLRQLDPHCDAPALLPFLGRPTALRRMLENILSNAARYGNGKTEVQLTQQDGQVFISIGDNGAGIPPEKREHVLRPFTRLESARGTASGGVGLGLAIAQDIAHRHGGALTLSKSRLGGLLVTVHLPKRSLPAENTPT
jgi:two-component system osmolarity sensor histidine kinase EnvZ